MTSSGAHNSPRVLLFDWGDTLMRDNPAEIRKMRDWLHVEALPGANETLATLRARGYRLIIATNAAESCAHDVLSALDRVDLAVHVERVYTARDLGITKRDPRFYSVILADLGVSAHDAVMIGDAWSSDVLAAHAAGLDAVWLSDAPAPGDLPPGVRQVRTLMDLLRLFPPLGVTPHLTTS
ncbi:HAD family hydrolase [Deinococcus maricopensis]|uniref:HAD-superfamily hydrolase, subfamily IA, variant 1 n=1 Tax=Deinococcus maricopensis (strain DSM 21211 / LMG 22137 / NRRL B-23946 / LB-34) TaxID=709986 RepID=E8U7R6_DEIML|nr:HAD-IA family hydrolase [Deinococcus maricopensis]ADV67105.1 HAD-superfamily hydrolase, subfamily IA, variant 1 [Deinococcus maricopensis DSM 21211]